MVVVCAIAVIGAISGVDRLAAIYDAGGTASGVGVGRSSETLDGVVEPMTPEQQQLVRYAVAMGWSNWEDDNELDFDGTGAANRYFRAWIGKKWHNANTLPLAIYAAVDAALGEMKP